eukprot:SAG31_NODE_2518_length_5574_cov_9.105205_8_plen_79_part_00
MESIDNWPTAPSTTMTVPSGTLTTIPRRGNPDTYLRQQELNYNSNVINGNILNSKMPAPLPTCRGSFSTCRHTKSSLI